MTTTIRLYIRLAYALLRRNIDRVQLVAEIAESAHGVSDLRRGATFGGAQ